MNAQEKAGRSDGDFWVVESIGARPNPWASLDFVDTCSGRAGFGVVSLGLRWGFVVQGRVQSLAIVENLDVVEEGSPQLHASCPGAAVDEFGLEGREEGLGDGVVPAVALSTHAHLDAERVELL